jgi:hypothetical protein
MNSTSAWFANDCLWLNYLPYWLGYVDTHLVKPELRDKISRVKLELADVDWSAYRSHILPPEVRVKHKIQPA